MQVAFSREQHKNWNSETSPNHSRVVEAARKLAVPVPCAERAGWTRRRRRRSWRQGFLLIGTSVRSTAARVQSSDRRFHATRGRPRPPSCVRFNITGISFLIRARTSLPRSIWSHPGADPGGGEADGDRRRRRARGPRLVFCSSRSASAARPRAECNWARIKPYWAEYASTLGLFTRRGLLFPAPSLCGPAHRYCLRRKENSKFHLEIKKKSVTHKRLICQGNSCDRTAKLKGLI